MKMSNPKKLLILDGSHIAYRAYYKFFNLKDFDGNKTSVIFGMPRIIESLIRNFNPDRVFLVMDGGRSQYRNGLLSDYKLREQKLGFDKEDFYKQKDAARDMLMSIGITVVWKKNEEADDLIAMVARRYSKKNWHSIIISGDKDFNQLITSGDNAGQVDVHNVSKHITLTYENLLEVVGYTPEQCVDYLCLDGDKSDHIQGYPGVGPKTAFKFLEQFGSIKAFLKSDQKFGKMDKGKLKEIYKLNKRLIDLKHYYLKFFLKEPIPIMGGTDFSEEEFTKYCSRYETNSFLKPQFLNTFKNLYHAKK